MILDPISETLLFAIHRGQSIRGMCEAIGVSSHNAVRERINVLEGRGYVLPPTKKGGRDRRLSKMGYDHMKAQGYL